MLNFVKRCWDVSAIVVDLSTVVAVPSNDSLSRGDVQRIESFNTSCSEVHVRPQSLFRTFFTFSSWDQKDRANIYGMTSKLDYISDLRIRVSIFLRTVPPVYTHI